MTLQVRQSSQCSDESWWNWSVWLDGPVAELNAVESVTYTLHPTFADPVRLVKTRKNGFRLDSEAWGEFELFIDILKKDGKRVKKTHYLKLEVPAAASASASGAVPMSRAPMRGAPTKSAITKPPSRPPANGPAGRGAAAASPAPTAPGRKVAPAAAAPAPMQKYAGKPPAAPAAQAAPIQAPQQAPAPSAPRVFVSSGAADAEYARKLRDHLEQRGYKVTSADSVKAGVPADRAIKQAIDTSDATVFIVSGTPSLWSNLEMNYAANRKVGGQVIPVLLGTRAEVPAPLASFSAVRVDSSQEVGSVANEIVKFAEQNKR